MDDPHAISNHIPIVDRASGQELWRIEGTLLPPLGGSFEYMDPTRQFVGKVVDIKLVVDRRGINPSPPTLTIYVEQTAETTNP